MAFTNVSLEFGSTARPYSVSKPHHGIDYPESTGTPVPVSGKVIGLVGSTGQSTGPHLHVDKNTGKYVDPSDWRTITGKVSFAGPNGTAGNMVAITTPGGALYRFLHLSKINVNVGDYIGGEMQEEIDRLVGHVQRREQEVKDLKKEVERLLGHVHAREADVKSLNKELTALRAQVGDATKWQTLRTLLREFLGIK